MPGQCLQDPVESLQGAVDLDQAEAEEVFLLEHAAGAAFRDPGPQRPEEQLLGG